MFCRALREEFRLRKIYYEHHDPSAFYKDAWKWPRFVFPTIRVILGVYMVYAYTYELTNFYISAIDKKEYFATENTTEVPFGTWTTDRPWWVFFTEWSYTVLMLHMVVSAVLSVAFCKRETISENSYQLSESGGEDNSAFDKGPGDKHVQGSSTQGQDAEDDDDYIPLAWYFKLSWLLSNIIIAVAPIVSAIFFAFLFQPPLDYFNAHTHLLNTVFVVIDQIISARPVRLLHIIAPFIYGTVYTVFNVIFWSFDHENNVVYPGVIDWNYPGQAVTNLLIQCGVGFPLVLFIWFSFYHFKLWLSKHVCGS